MNQTGSRPHGRSQLPGSKPHSDCRPGSRPHVIACRHSVCTEESGSGRDQRRSCQSELSASVDRLHVMNFRQSAPHRGGHALRLAGLLVVLGGLLGMHGLGSHGLVDTAGASQGAMADMADMADMATTPATTGLTSVVGHIADHVGPRADRAQRPSEAASASTPAGMSMDMAMMCVAVLALALIALLRFLLGARKSPVLWMLRGQPRALMHRRRDSGRPSLIALSIQRC